MENGAAHRRVSEKSTFTAFGVEDRLRSKLKVHGSTLNVVNYEMKLRPVSPVLFATCWAPIMASFV